MMLTRLFATLALTGIAIWSAQAQELDGVWRGEGYGDVFQIQDSAVKMFQVTATTCVAGSSAEREPGAIEGREATFKTVDGDVFFVRAGGAADHKLLHHPAILPMRDWIECRGCQPSAINSRPTLQPRISKSSRAPLPRTAFLSIRGELTGMKWSAPIGPKSPRY
jgi:hypothetical protein